MANSAKEERFILIDGKRFGFEDTRKTSGAGELDNHKKKNARVAQLDAAFLGDGKKPLDDIGFVANVVLKLLIKHAEG